MQDYPQYRSQQKIIHWLSAVVVILAFLIIMFKIILSQFLGGMPNIYLLHKSIGVLVFILTIWRIKVIIQYGIPDVLDKHQRLQRILSKSTQGFIYIFLLIVPLSGYLMSSRPLNFFGMISIPAINVPNEFYQFFHTTHLVSSYLLAILIMLHVIGALYHYFWVKDKVLQSMLIK
ncbi:MULTISPECIES: cytochrome b [unclassified Gilliamella]|uniref:cytochrome b n=1 Tax=unclassified Gilliamella TaxID=2685620 RepID=UPI001C69B03A|nr:cytochrome b [Gilliamella sp. ESL0441]QYN44556.1 cytochrome b [Gilliamella sp. ESL0441]